MLAINKRFITKHDKGKVRKYITKQPILSCINVIEMYGYACTCEDANMEILDAKPR